MYLPFNITLEQAKEINDKLGSMEYTNYSQINTYFHFTSPTGIDYDSGSIILSKIIEILKENGIKKKW